MLAGYGTKEMKSKVKKNAKKIIYFDHIKDII